MLTGLTLFIMGWIVLIYPQVLVVLFSGILIATGATIMLISWRMRRLKQAHHSRFVNWVIRY
jgi:hypothetical protein